MPHLNEPMTKLKRIEIMHAYYGDEKERLGEIYFKPDVPLRRKAANVAAWAIFSSD